MGKASTRNAPPSSRSSRGFTLIEALTVLALLTLFLGATVPAASRMLARARLRAAARDLASTFRQCRLEAALTAAQIGVVFDPSADWSWSVFRDGNGNGVRRIDIRAGIDRRVLGPVSAGTLHEGAALRFLPLARISKIPPERGFIVDRVRPVQFGPSDIVSFSPSGSSSSGTVYLSIGAERMAAVRLYGPTARVRLWEYDPTGDFWTEW